MGSPNLPLSLSLIFCLLTVGATGCLADRETSGGELGATQQASTTVPAATDTWSRNASVTTQLLFRYGLPFLAFGGTNAEDECSTFRFSVPDGTSELHVSLTSRAVNLSQPGAGFAALFLRQPDDRAVTSEPLPPQEEVTLSFQEPLSGPWSVQIFPDGIIVNQSFTVTASLHGHGSPPGAFSFESDSQCV